MSRILHLNVLAAALAVALLCQEASAADGKVTSVIGTATANRAGAVIVLSNGSVIHPGDKLQTEASSMLRIKMDDGAEISLGSATSMKIVEYSEESGSILLDLFQGAFRSVTGLIGKSNKEKWRARTTTAVIGIRGTTLEIRANKTLTVLHTEEGISVLKSNQKSIEVVKGHFAKASKDDLSELTQDQANDLLKSSALDEVGGSHKTGEDNATPALGKLIGDADGQKCEI